MPVPTLRDDKGHRPGFGTRIIPLAVVLTLYTQAAPPARSQQIATKSLPIPAVRPAYPRVDLASGYQLDPTWPARLADVKSWGAMAGIAVDPRGRIWTFNRGTVPVQVFEPDGTLVRSWGEGQFREPHQVRFDHDENVWLADSGLHVVRKFTPEGKLLMTLGTPGSPGDDSTHLNRPTDMAISPTGDIFISDGYGNNRLVHFDSRGRFVKTWGRLGTGPGEFSLPHSIALDSKGRLYVADRNNARIQVFDQAGRFLAEWRSLLVPWHISITDRDEIYVCGSSPMRWPKLPIPGLPLGIPPKDQLVMVFDPDGRIERLWTFPKGQTPGALDWVHGLATDKLGNLYLGDIQGRRAQKFRLLEAGRGETGPLAKDKNPRRDEPVQRAGHER